MRRLIIAALALGCSISTARAQDEEPAPSGEDPDLEFLEYLGSWAEDDEWLELEEWRKAGDADLADEEPEQSDENSGDEHEGE